MNKHFTFEDLPNEIFHELFEYFSIYELYRTFTRLNSRMNSLIQYFRFHQIILHSLEDIDLPVHRYFLPNVSTLIINHSKQFLQPTQSVFPSIRCLILCKPTREQWNAIQPNLFPSLQRLYLINSVFAYRTEQLCQLIFSNQFSSLSMCSLPFVAYEEHYHWTISPVLQSLTISVWDIRVYKQILDSCPNLIRLKIQITGGTIDDGGFSLSDICVKHSLLQSLTLHSVKSISCELIDWILSFVPNLTELMIHVTDQRTSYIPLNRLASIFRDRTSRLNQLKIDVTIPESLCAKDKLNSNYPLFQLSRIQSAPLRPSRLIILGSI